LRVALTPAGRKLRDRALDIPPAMMSRLDMSVEELREFHQRLTEVIRRAGDVAGE
jgi:hypothetical protein